MRRKRIGSSEDVQPVSGDTEELGDVHTPDIPVYTSDSEQEECSEWSLSITVASPEGGTGTDANTTVPKHISKHIGVTPNIFLIEGGPTSEGEVSATSTVSSVNVYKVCHFNEQGEEPEVWARLSTTGAVLRFDVLQRSVTLPSRL
jgi:hypothetical protein